ncbi:MAG: helix-turn-helix domain-containing protein [Patescibacteria group bacterium]|nr:helix-turn-helix domain-containing protein [Patescibacteria group bacterium]
MPQDSTKSSPRLITAREAARCVGITKSTFYDWLARGYLPCHRFGRTIRVNTADLQAYLIRTRMNDLATPRILEAQRTAGIVVPDASRQELGPYAGEQAVINHYMRD